jgi:hypothetical protein
MGGHHLILGTLRDFLSGEPLDDTLDERYRQEIARRLVEEKGYATAEIEPRRPVELAAGGRRARILLDFLVRLEGRPAMIVRFGPGSLVSRERPTLAIARVAAEAPVPIAVVTNGKTAEILDVASGKVLAEGLEAIPDRVRLAALLDASAAAPLTAERRERELRIAYCYEVDGACPCDETVCRLA